MTPYLMKTKLTLKVAALVALISAVLTHKAAVQILGPVSK
jgi:hypothetical protein